VERLQNTFCQASPQDFESLNWADKCITNKPTKKSGRGPVPLKFCSKVRFLKVLSQSGKIVTMVTSWVGTVYSISIVQIGATLLLIYFNSTWFSTCKRFLKVNNIIFFLSSRNSTQICYCRINIIIANLKYWFTIIIIQ